MAVSLTDQMQSLGRFLVGEFPSIPVHLERNPVGVTPPAFLIELVQAATKPGSRRLREDLCSWQVTYDPGEAGDRLQILDHLGSRLAQRGAVGAYLVDYRYPPPTEVTVVSGAIAPGTYQVQVTGFGADGSESLPCDPIAVVLETPAAIRLRIPRIYPGSAGPFVRYGLYVDGQQQAIIERDPIGNTDAEIQALPLPGAPGLPTASAIYYGGMRLSDFTAQPVQDEAGALRGIVRFQTRLLVPVPAVVGDKIEVVAIATEANRS